MKRSSGPGPIDIFLLAVLLGLAIVALVASSLFPAGLAEVPVPEALPPGAGHWLGTDELGQDVLRRLLEGMQTTMGVGIGATILAMVFGSIYGAIAGLAGRRTDEVMMRGVDVGFALPYMLLVILLMSFFGQSLLLLFLALGFVEWLPLSRVVRAGVHNLRDEPYLEAARMMGGKQIYVLWSHLIPQLGAPLIVYATLMLPMVMMQEAFLSFLGLGVPPPMASWGTMIADGVRLIDTAPWILIASAGTLAIWLGCLYAAGDRLAKSLNIRRSTGVADPSLAAVDLGHIEKHEGETQR